MDDIKLEQIHIQIKEFSERASKAVEIAEASAKVSYKASLDIQTYNNAFKNTLDRIENQTIKTNGSVKNLQLWQASTKGWINGFGVSLLVILGLVSYIFVSLNNSETKTQDLLSKHLAQNIIK